jgi:hypothetical protein
MHTHPLGLTTIAFVVTAIPAFLLTKIIGKHLESLHIIGSSLLIGGVVMWIVDAMNATAEAAGPVTGSRIHTWKMEAMSLGQAVWIGACQILSAVFPGTSRSMATIAAGQLAGMSRASALEFSFSSISSWQPPLHDLGPLRGKGANPIGVSQIDPHGWVVLAIGFGVSFLVAYARRGSSPGYGNTDSCPPYIASSREFWCWRLPQSRELGTRDPTRGCRPRPLGRGVLASGTPALLTRYSFPIH